jgi:TolA-binding protein
LSVIHRRNNENGNAALAEALLDEATALENEDLAQAAAKYEEVVAQYPNTASGKLARSCLRTLKSNKI